MSPSIPLGTLYRDITNTLAAAAITTPQLEARILLAHALGIEQTRILGYPEDEIDPDAAQQLAQLVARRTQGEPIAYITGSKEFWSLDFKVSRETLIPRPDSETLIEAVLAATPDKNAKMQILDLGTGSGCLLLALLSELPNAQGLGIDITPKACAIARANAENLGLTDRAAFTVGDWMAGLEGKFDIIISNPPYIVAADIAGLAPDVKQFEPHLALSGGPDGLNAYRKIAAQAGTHLAPEGLLGVEIGIGQVTDIKEILSHFNFKIQKIAKDLGNIERCILATVEDS